MAKKVIIIGASSGIGRELAKIYSSKGYELGLTARRKTLLEELASELPEKTYISAFDIADTDNAIPALEKLISDMKEVDIIIVSSGTGDINQELEWACEKNTIDTNVSGFSAMANVAMRYFLERKSGHLAAISSVAALRGAGAAPAYNASKAFVSNYLEGLRQKAVKEGGTVTVTDIKPGFVDTAMAKGEGLFWVADTSKAAMQIYNAVRLKKKSVYVTKRWALIAWLLKIIPDCIYNRL